MQKDTSVLIYRDNRNIHMTFFKMGSVSGEEMRGGGLGRSQMAFDLEFQVNRRSREWRPCTLCWAST